MALDYVNWMNRIAALYVEALAELGVQADAKPYFWHWQESFPFITLQLGEQLIDGGSLSADDATMGEEIDVYDISVTAYLYAASIDSNLRGENDQALLTWIPHLIEHFNSRELLQSEAFPDAPDDLLMSRIVACSGVGILPGASAGQGTSVLGATFTHALRPIINIEQAYT
jgi:hypothetical protein